MAQKSISDLGEKAETGLKEEVEAAITDLQAALDGDDYADIKEKSETLSSALMKMGEAAYQTEQPAEDGQPRDDDDGVVDADFEEVDDSKSAKNG